MGPEQCNTDPKPLLDALAIAYGNAISAAKAATTCKDGFCVSNVGPAPMVNQILVAAEKTPELARVLMLFGNGDLSTNAALPRWVHSG